MRIIPVIDLLNDQVVHAVRGERQNYRPVRSVLCASSEPIPVARAFRDRLGLSEIYIADLNSIQGSQEASHRQAVRTLAGIEKMDIILDAGISKHEDILEWLGLGVRKVVVAAETVQSFDQIRQLPGSIDRSRLVFSLDLQSGKILSRCPELAAMDPTKALCCIRSAGWREIILLDLSRVGSEQGFDGKLVCEARVRFPDLSLLVGGGIANPQQLDELRSMGVAGVLLATALHGGVITARHLASPNAGEDESRSAPI